MFNVKDLSTFSNNIDDLEKKLIKIENETLQPTRKIKLEMIDIVLDFIKTNKRKLYGGYAQNILIKKLSPEDAFYSDDTIPDLDFYSPEPIKDAIKLSNIFVEKGYPRISASQAIHDETYSIFVDYVNVADISYVPKNVYNKIPYVEIDGVNYTAPMYIFIDMLKMITDPVVSGTHRWKKTFPRIYLLQQHYPFNKATSPLNIKKNNTPDLLMGIIIKFIKNNDNVIITGDYAYNCFLQASGILKQNNTKIFKYIDVSFYEMHCLDYVENTKELYKLLKDSDFGNDISLIEYYPMSISFPSTSEIYYKDILIAQTIHRDYKCIPIKKINYIIFDNDNATIDKDNMINIGSFDFNLLSELKFWFRNRVMDNKEKMKFHSTKISHLIEFKRYFYDNNKNKNILSDTLFEQFITSCVGDTIHPMRKSRLDAEKRKEKGKQIIWRYTPNKNNMKEPESTFVFNNSSGNIITNQNNLKVLKIEK